MAKSYDVLVVGAGPAGATAAKLLAGAGYHALLVDKARFPPHKTCASWIFRSRLACGVAARAFLYGEPVGLGTLARALWS